MYNKYLSLCRTAMISKVAYNNFRNDVRCRGMVETLKVEHADILIEEIKKHSKYLIPLFSKFCTSDTMGNPELYEHKDIRMNISPTTLRYIKILGDLTNLFGSLENLNIVEIGCGYGGQCKIIHDYVTPKSYTLIDFPEVQKLSQKFLKRYGVIPILREITDSSEIDYDLCISNFAFAELNRKDQDFYYRNIIKHSKAGYFICNIFGNSKDANHTYTKEEYYTLGENVKMFPEIPDTGINNLIYYYNGLDTRSKI